MRSIICAAAVAVGLFVSVSARAAVTEDAFLVRNTGDLVSLCSTDRADPMYTPAQNFCHGFAVGTYRTLVEAQAGMRGKKKLFCPPQTGSGNRNEGIAAFVSWAGEHNDLMALPATDGIAQFLTSKYPCK